MQCNHTLFGPMGFEEDFRFPILRSDYAYSRRLASYDLLAVGWYENLIAEFGLAWL